MNFEQLRSIVKNIKTQMTCPSCGIHFDNEDIYVVSSIQNKSVLMVKCHGCETSFLVTATVHAPNEVDHHVPENILKNIEKAPAKGKVMIDDVIDMHQFLKDFSGDFHEAFGENEKLKTKN